MPNQAAERLLEEYGYPGMKSVVDLLVEHGYIVDIPLSDPERLAEQARKWIKESRPEVVFDKAAGWTTESWEVVTGEKFDTPAKIKWIFAALVILAKEAKIDL